MFRISRTARILAPGLGLVVALTIGAPAAVAGSTPGQTTGPVPSKASAAAKKAQPKLSGRLQALAKPDVASLPAAEQSARVGAPAAGAGSLRRQGSRIGVQARLADTSAATLAALRGAGAQIVFSDSALRVADLAIEPAALPALAALPSVLAVGELVAPRANGCPTGVLSEGDAQLRATQARSTYGVDGTGVIVGILSDSFNIDGRQASETAQGELPGAGNPCGRTSPLGVVESANGGGDEGRAMAQIVHDLAPGATLNFAAAPWSQAGFAQKIRDLAAGGAKVIVDDISYLDEPFYQDGVIAKAISDVTAAGVTYFSSAGNSNDAVTPRGSATAVSGGSYEAAAFRPTACPPAIVAHYAATSATPIDCHDFAPIAGAAKPTWTVGRSGALQLAMGWSEPEYGVTTDLDVCAVDTSTQAVLVCGDDDSVRFGSANELIYGLAGTQTIDLVVIRYGAVSTTPRFKLISLAGTITTSDLPHPPGNGDVVGPSAFGHNVSRDTISTAAIRYNATTTVESFSSRGPALTCWGPVVGTAPAAALASCQTSTIDLTATDGALNSFFGTPDPRGGYRFYGTSAAAPHAAAVAALVWQAGRCYTRQNVVDALQQTAAAVAGNDVNARGAGMVNAEAAVARAAGFACPLTATDKFIKASFQDFLNRQPTATELASYRSRLDSGALSRTDYLYALANSPEWVSAIVAQMYRDTLNREPDPGGLAYWVDIIRSGRNSVAGVAALFYASDEFYSVLGKGTVEGWVEQLYAKLLKRAPDSGGLAYWSAVARAQGRTSVTWPFYQSEESRTVRVNTLYVKLLGRPGDPGGLSYWVPVVQTQGDIAVAISVALSAEYYNRAQSRY